MKKPSKPLIPLSKFEEELIQFIQREGHATTTNVQVWAKANRFFLDDVAKSVPRLLEFHILHWNKDTSAFILTHRGMDHFNFLKDKKRREEEKVLSSTRKKEFKPPLYPPAPPKVKRANVVHPK